MKDRSSGWTPVRFESADLSALFFLLNERGIRIREVTQYDELTAEGKIRDVDLKSAMLLADRRGDVLKPHIQHGTGKGILRRPVLIVAFFLYCFISIYLPTRVLVVKVEGNYYIPDRYILEKAEPCGIGFWSSKREIRSEKAKNRLMKEIPELQWVGVNSYGCVAVISVREKNRTDINFSPAAEATEIIASRDGVISYSSVTEGNCLCKVGQAVKKGQTLVIPYTDVGLGIFRSGLNAEIYAQTDRRICIKTLKLADGRDEYIGSDKKLSLIIGKKLIKLHKGSGILGTTCDRMYMEKFMELPGGFTLPFGIAYEECRYYETSSEELSTDACSVWLRSAAEKTLQDNMVAGEFIGASYSLQDQTGAICLLGRYSCLEMIAQYRYEEQR